MRVIHKGQPVFVCDFCGRSHTGDLLRLAPYTHAAICTDCIATPIGLFMQPDAPESTADTTRQERA